jgi:hypothetical protein
MHRLGTFTYRDRQQGIDKLLAREEDGFKLGDGTERSSWFWHNGRQMFRASVGQLHGGGKTVPPGTMKDLLEHLRVDADWFDELARCKRRLPEYIQLLRDMGVIT